MLNGGASSWDEAAKHASMQPLQAATWNLDALKTSVDVAAALDFDILALQELRVDQCAAAGIQAKVKSWVSHFMLAAFHSILGRAERLNLIVKSLGLVSFLKTPFLQGKASSRLLTNGISRDALRLLIFLFMNNGSLSSVFMPRYMTPPLCFKILTSLRLKTLASLLSSLVTVIKTPGLVLVSRSLRMMDGCPSPSILISISFPIVKLVAPPALTRLLFHRSSKMFAVSCGRLTQINRGMLSFVRAFILLRKRPAHGNLCQKIVTLSLLT